MASGDTSKQCASESTHLAYSVKTALGHQLGEKEAAGETHIELAPASLGTPRYSEH